MTEKKPHYTIQWSQDRLNVLIAVSSGSKNIKGHLTDDANAIIIEIDDIPSELKLYAPYIVSKSAISVQPCGNLTFRLAKKKTEESWPRLPETTERLHYISSDWSKFTEDNSDDSSDEHVCTGLVDDVEITEKDCTLKIITAPLLQDILIDDSSTQKYWKEDLTSAQRLHTLIRLWNKTTDKDRKSLMQTLIKIMKNVNSEFYEFVKGGNLPDLPAGHYATKKVAFVQLWEKQYSDDEAQYNIMYKLFSLLTEKEQTIVFCTFT